MLLLYCFAAFGIAILITYYFPATFTLYIFRSLYYFLWIVDFISQGLVRKTEPTGVN